jgi:hypothetical protein
MITGIHQRSVRQCKTSHMREMATFDLSVKIKQWEKKKGRHQVRRQPSPP